MKELTTDECIMSADEYKKQLLEFINTTQSWSDLRWLYVAMRCCDPVQSEH